MSKQKLEIVLKSYAFWTCLIVFAVSPNLVLPQDNYAIYGDPSDRYAPGEGGSFFDLIAGLIMFAVIGGVYEKFKLIGVIVLIVGTFSTVALAGIVYRALF